jgi:hypothetical protein
MSYRPRRGRRTQDQPRRGVQMAAGSLLVRRGGRCAHVRAVQPVGDDVIEAVLVDTLESAPSSRTSEVSLPCALASLLAGRGYRHCALAASPYWNKRTGEPRLVVPRCLRGCRTVRSVSRRCDQRSGPGPHGKRPGDNAGTGDPSWNPYSGSGYRVSSTSSPMCRAWPVPSAPPPPATTTTALFRWSMGTAALFALVDAGASGQPPCRQRAPHGIAHVHGGHGCQLVRVADEVVVPA